MSEEIIRIVEITRYEKDGSKLGSYCQTEKEANIILDEIAEGEPGDKWTLELLEMSKSDYEKMPEFVGY